MSPPLRHSSDAARCLHEFHTHPNSIGGGTNGKAIRRALTQEEHDELIAELDAPEPDRAKIARELADVEQRILKLRMAFETMAMCWTGKVKVQAESAIVADDVAAARRYDEVDEALRDMPSGIEQPGRAFIRYRDDGPSGPCGQTTSTTSPWDRLYVYEGERAERDAEAFMRWLVQNQHAHGRRNPRIDGWWYEDDGLSVLEGPVVPEAER